MDKVLYSVTELVGMGYPKRSILCDVHAKKQDFAICTAGGGKWYINKSKYDAYLERRTHER